MDFFNTIKPNTTLLTPNRRLSASLLKKYAEWQTAQGNQCWQTLDILPLYPSWLDRLWKEYSAHEISENRILLTPSQEQILWEKILRDDPKNESLLQISETAKLAKSAWEILKRWRVDLADASLPLTEDSRAFLRWATQFQKLCKKNHWLDQNSLVDIIIEKIQQNQIKPPKQIILIGFTEIAPQYHYLFNICEQYGSTITHHEPISRNQTTFTIGLTDNETELHTVARWAKSCADKGETVGCIIPSLESVRDSAIQIFTDVFDGYEFNISAGKSLISYPIIHDALQLLNLGSKTLSANTLSTILRSPFIGEAEHERYKRALYDNKLHSSNIAATTLHQLIDPTLRHNLVNSCPALAKQITHFLEKFEQNKKPLPISKWVTLFNELLKTWGWPGERSLNSHEYQVVQNSWLPLLNEYATFDAILEPLHYHDALHYLTCLASNKIFQPESPESSVHILGILEAAEISFDHAWIMGLDDTTWPSRPKPNPFIPLRLQKSLNMPNASAERELLYCQQLTKQLQTSSNHVVFSYPLQRDDTELRPSSILKNYNTIEMNQLSLSDFTSSADKIYQTQQLEWLQDDMAPPLAESDDTHGGVSIFKSQAQCPFKAFAELRLHAKKIEDTTIGLRKLDRGNMVHKALELIWRELKDLSTLIKKSDVDLREFIQHCAKQALQAIVEAPHERNTRYLELELHRLEKILWDWLQIEKTRSPFTTIALEQEITATIGNIKAKFRVDRIDQLTDETSNATQLIIDYKTGKDIDKKDWFGERLNEPQLPIYCIANPDNTIGIAFGKINPNRMEMVGASKVPLKMNSIKPISAISQADAKLWQEQTQIWQTNLTKLADDFYHGKAHVDPKDVNQTCRLCGLQSLCRVHEITDFDEEYDNYE